MTWVFRLISVAILLVFIQTIFFKKIGLSSVSCMRRFSSRYAFEGEEIFLMEEINNNRPIPVPLLIIESRINKNIELSSAVELDVNDSNYHRSIFSMLPFSKIVRKHTVKLLKRGYYDLKSVNISSYDLLGFSKVMIDEMPVNAVVTVYPVLLETDDLKFPCHSFLGDVIVRRWIIDDPFLNAGVRAYQQSDPLKSINWKASARTGTLQINKHDYSANTKMLVLFNVDLSEHQWHAASENARLEYAVSLCATTVKYALENSMEVGFASNGSSVLEKGNTSEIPFGSGEQHLYSVLEALALLNFSHVYSFHYFLNQLIKTGICDTDILIITPYMDQEIQDQVEMLRYLSNAVEILIPDGGSTYET